MSLRTLIAWVKRVDEPKKNKAGNVSDESVNLLIARYSRGSVALQQEDGYMTKEEKDALKKEVLKHKFA